MQMSVVAVHIYMGMLLIQSAMVAVFTVSAYTVVDYTIFYSVFV